jgi:hypothetical protein
MGTPNNDTLNGGKGQLLISRAASEDLLIGGNGDDTLDGGLGADFLVGGAGNDTYIVDDIGDEVYETANRGVDIIQASVSFDLRHSRHVENLTLTGTAALDGTGNTLDNRLVGNAGNNRLNGGGGQDTLEGGNGADTYVFKGRFGSDVVRDHHTPPVTMPQFNAGGQFTFSGGELTFSDDLFTNLNVGSGSFTNNLVSTDTFNLGNGGNLTFTGGDFFGDSTLINGGLINGGSIANGGGFTFSDPLTVTDLGNLTPDLFGVVDLSASVNPYDLVTADQWDKQPNTDSLRFEDVSYNKLWFRQIGQDLEVSVVGATDKVTVRDWYASPNDKVELSYDAGNAHVLRYDKVQGLVAAMAGFSPQALSGNAMLTAARDAAWVSLA